MRHTWVDGAMVNEGPRCIESVIERLVLRQKTTVPHAIIAGRCMRSRVQVGPVNGSANRNCNYQRLKSKTLNTDIDYLGRSCTPHVRRTAARFVDWNA